MPSALTFSAEGFALRLPVAISMLGNYEQCAKRQ